MNRKIVPAVLVLLLLAACHKIKNITDYNAWLNDPGHGCLQNKHIAGLEVSAKYLPATYVALKDRTAGGNAISRDSLKLLQQKQVTFLMSIRPDKEDKQQQSGSVAYKDVHSYGEYADRIISMNFFMDQHVKMYLGDSAYVPAIAIAENVYELSDGKNFMIVFAAGRQQIETAKDILFVYDDPFFKLGTVQLRFSPEALAKANALNVY